jgi:hypothetical protein
VFGLGQADDCFVKHYSGHTFLLDGLENIGSLVSVLGFKCFNVNKSVHYFAANFEIDWTSTIATVTFDCVD